MIKNSDIGPIKKFFLKLLTELQEYALNAINPRLHLFWTELHFRLYFGFSLSEAINNDRYQEIESAVDRYGCMAIKSVFAHSNKENKKIIFNVIKKRFFKNLLLRVLL